MAATVERISLDQSQRDDALELANQVRSWRAQLKRDIKARDATVLAVVLTDHRWLATMKVWDLVAAQPGRGFSKTAKLMSATGIPSNKRFQALTDRQRSALIKALA